MPKGELGKAEAAQKKTLASQRLTKIQDQRGTRRPSGKVKKKKARHK